RPPCGTACFTPRALFSYEAWGTWTSYPHIPATVAARAGWGRGTAPAHRRRAPTGSDDPAIAAGACG
ncbi:hypothetical protein, partial [Nocardia brasiliensis]|uniref:hypothetical protein n=1 Tax=Nocardia brasiliensis TaxID=37326 RepID=UPI0024577761